ncbi:MAG: hypothetical protein ACOZBL_02565 [Patescibacteria group bacterium]
MVDQVDEVVEVVVDDDQVDEVVEVVVVDEVADDDQVDYQVHDSQILLIVSILIHQV